jgi:DNA-binding beta-propeller fold protein YncE
MRRRHGAQFASSFLLRHHPTMVFSQMLAKKYGLLAALIFCTFLPGCLSAAAPGGQAFQVRYVTQFHTLQDLGRQKSITRKIADTIFGEKPCSLVKPFSVLTGTDGSLWIADQGSASLWYIPPSHDRMEQFSGDDKQPFRSLVGLAQDDQKRILFTDSAADRLYMLNPSSQPRPFAEQIGFSRPTGVAFSDNDLLFYVAETNRHCLSVVDKNGRLIRRIGQRGTGPGEFNFPTFICIDHSGIIYVVDSMNFRVQLFSASGLYLSQFGTQGDASGYFASPKGIAVDSFGHIYVVDALFHAVQIFDHDGNYLYSFGKQGQEAGQFWLPVGIYIDQQNRIYVADSYNSRIQIFQLDQENQ